MAEREKDRDARPGAEERQDSRRDASRRMREMQERLRRMVDRDTERAAGVLRNWLKKDGR